MVTFVDPVSVPEREENLLIRIFPNPNNGQFTLEITTEKPGEASIQIFNLTGSLIAEQKTMYLNGKTTAKISLPDSPEGMFYLKLQKEGYLFVEKFLIIN